MPSCPFDEDLAVPRGTAGGPQGLFPHGWMTRLTKELLSSTAAAMVAPSEQRQGGRVSVALHHRDEHLNPFPQIWRKPMRKILYVLAIALLMVVAGCGVFAGSADCTCGSADLACQCTGPDAGDCPCCGDACSCAGPSAGDMCACSSGECACGGTGDCRCEGSCSCSATSTELACPCPAPAPAPVNASARRN